MLAATEVTRPAVLANAARQFRALGRLGARDRVDRHVASRRTIALATQRCPDYGSGVIACHVSDHVDGLDGAIAFASRAFDAPAIASAAEQWPPRQCWMSRLTVALAETTRRSNHMVQNASRRL